MNPVDEIYAAQERLFTSAFDKAKTYSQVVHTIGYAGIFAAWSFTKSLLTPGQLFWSAFLATLSIMFFVLFEVLTMFVISRSFMGMAKALRDKSKFLEVMQQNEKEQRRLHVVYMQVWAPIWIISFSTGVAAAGILLGAFAGHLWASR
jgi:hypothetical protein